MRLLPLCVAAALLASLFARAESPAVPACRPCPLDPPPLPAPAPAGAPGLPPLPERSARNANYTIEARLDPEARILDGRLVLEWRNTTGRPQQDLPLHLYWNAFRNTLSTSARGEGRHAAHGRGGYDERAYGWVHLTSVRQLDEAGQAAADLTSTLRYLQPDDGNTDDRTLAQVSAASPVPPEGTVRLGIDWTARIPYGDVGRSGWVHDYHFVAQWFPKIAAWWRGGWNAHQFHPFSEFFSDFGVYDVRLTVPSGFVVGATGALTEERDNPDGTRTLRFRQEDVHDFAWVAGRRLQERRGRFEEPGLPPVDIRLLVQPEHAHLAGRYLEATRIALRSYGTWSAPYPYAQLTVVDPAWNSASGGMEYPTLFTGGAGVFSPIALRSPESVTVHEAGHQFWYGLVATNEFEEAWLDEGMNNYHEEKALQVALGPGGWGRRYFGPLTAGRRGLRAPWPVVAPGVWLRRGANELAALRKTGLSDVMARRAWDYRSADAYVLNSYGKPALALQTLEGLVGDEVMTRILRTYARRYRFAHPSNEDFMAVVNEVTGQDYAWFFRETFFSSEACDYAISVKNRKARVATGFAEGPDGRPTLLPSPPLREGEEGRHDAEVTVERRGGVRLPVEIRVEFADGRVVYERWDGQYRWHRLRYPGQKVRAADVDPFGRIALDVDPANNSWADNAPAARRAASKWAVRWMFWLQNLLELHTLLV